MATLWTATNRLDAKLAPGVRRRDKTVQEIAAKHQLHPNQVGMDAAGHGPDGQRGLR
ncbi:hypothetical protein [Salipiger aestuarii]|uniref:hypothetical protein n=1 Tax=Salipiger aestuarii TaxID=568098 RepID=UPI00025B654A|nr:hypothetical protein [Salipiger aestuarii]EIE49828.1 hypothetical protein C357_17408 [Citreicella sp. 357]